jgi:shikimate dehydrogenase
MVSGGVAVELSGAISYHRRMSDGFGPAIDATTRYCAVYGFPIRHSASPAMQNAGLAMLNLNWRYLAFEVHPDHLQKAIEGARAMKFLGLNLTVPHKLLALGMVDELDESGRIWGAVNTLRFEARNGAGEWRPLGEFSGDIPEPIRCRGFNTDADAITRSIQEDLGLPLGGTRVLLLGAGGAGRTAALKLACDGVKELFLVNRTRCKAEELAVEITRRYPGVACRVGYPTGGVDLLLNATSLGLKPGDGLPFDTREFDLGRAGAVYDMIYRPAETPLLAAAARQGRRVANGIGMLLYQGAKALEIWTGRPAPVAAMRTALVHNVYGGTH